MKNKKPLNILTINNFIYYPIYEFNGKYYIKETGDTVYTTVYNRELKTQVNNDGYYYNNLMFNGMQTKRFYHRLIANSLLLRKDGRDIINHKNSNRQDNRIKNLEWVYKYENYYHGIGEKNYKRDENTSQRLLTDKEIADIYTSNQTRSRLIQKHPKLTKRTYHDIKHDVLYLDVTKDLIKGKSNSVIHKETLDKINDSTLYDIWLSSYIKEDMNLKQLEKEYGIGVSFIKRRFKEMELPIRNGGNNKKVIMSLI